MQQFLVVISGVFLWVTRYGCIYRNILEIKCSLVCSLTLGPSRDLVTNHTHHCSQMLWRVVGLGAPEMVLTGPGYIYIPTLRP